MKSELALQVSRVFIPQYHLHIPAIGYSNALLGTDFIGISSSGRVATSPPFAPHDRCDFWKIVARILDGRSRRFAAMASQLSYYILTINALDFAYHRNPT